MGITTYLFHSSDNLDSQRFHMFFLDMGENIHFHYRDLRIELSVDEFMELAERFSQCAKQVQAEIEGGYQDGVLANTNETGTLKTFWDKQKPLTAPVKYHEKRLALEETKDGYHLHVRNYKILLSDESFRALAEAMSGINHLLANPEKLRREPYQLLKQNELHPQLLSHIKDPYRDELRIFIPHVYLKKAGQVLQAIGYSASANASNDNAMQYINGNSVVWLTDISDPAGTVFQHAVPGVPVDLPRFIGVNAVSLDAEQLNELKLKILYLLKQSASGLTAPFGLKDLFINPQTLTPAVDLFASATTANPDDEIQAFTKLLVDHKLFFIKPEKTVFEQQRRAAVQDLFFRFIHEQIACHQFVRKIIVLGSTSTQQLGSYRVPFIHFDWAKINSDFDIYVELEPGFDGNLPDTWEKKFYWNRTGADYFHFGDLGNGDASEWSKRFPGVRFYEHLVEGYLFDYRSGDRERRDQWLREVQGQCIFKRDRLAQWLTTQYQIDTITETEPINVASFNNVYLVHAPPSRYILKEYGTAYLNKKDQKRISVEMALLDALRTTDLEIAFPIRNRDGSYLSKSSNGLSTLFTYVTGSHTTNPSPAQIRTAGRLLARFHVSCQGTSIKGIRQFDNKASLDFWLKAWKQYQKEGVVGTDVDIDVQSYIMILNNLKTRTGPCHGDLSVINFLFEGDSCSLIDFQSVSFGPLIVDLANAMVEFSAKKRNFLAENMICMKEGYEEIRPLDTQEKVSLNDMVMIHLMTRQAKLMRLHFGGFGYDLKEDRLLGLKAGIEYMQQHPEPFPASVS